jgi:hypothetical protein
MGSDSSDKDSQDLAGEAMPLRGTGGTDTVSVGATRKI